MGSIQSSTMILCALGNRSASFLSRRAHLLTTPKGRWYFLRQPCALRADAASAEALWTMPHHGGAAVIVHADGSMFCFICTTRGWRFATPIPPPACDNLPPAVFRSYGYRSCDTIFFLRKRNKNRKREDGENGWRSITWKRRWSAEVRGALQLPLPLI